MKKQFSILATGLLAFLAPAQRQIIKDVNIIPISTNTLIKNKSVLIENGKIAAIDDFAKLKPQKSDHIIQAKGKFLMPSLADMHIHLPKANAVDTLMIYNLAAGVTRLRVMDAQLKQHELKLKQEHNQKLSPKLYYSYVYRKNEPIKKIDSIMQVVKTQGLSHFKMFSIASEQDFDVVMQKAKAQNTTVCGHYPWVVAMPKVLQSGFKSLEHLPAYLDEENIANLAQNIGLTKQNEVYNCPTLDYFTAAYNYAYTSGSYQQRPSFLQLPAKLQAKMEAKLAANAVKTGLDKMIKYGQNELKGYQEKQQLLKKLYDNQCLLLVGSDPSFPIQVPGFGMYDEMLQWQEQGLDPYTILKSATLNPAAFFNEAQQWGSVEVGKAAHLLILGQNPLEDVKNLGSLETTLCDGQIHHKKELLRLLVISD
jgi:imidazolonepropionase-like amidohydrolase